MRMKRGRKKNTNRYKRILFMRSQGMTITEIADKLDISKQGVWYYLEKYGDIDESIKEAINRRDA